MFKPPLIPLIFNPNIPLYSMPHRLQLQISWWLPFGIYLPNQKCCLRRPNQRWWRKLYIVLPSIRILVVLVLIRSSRIDSTTSWWPQILHSLHFHLTARRTTRYSQRSSVSRKRKFNFDAQQWRHLYIPHIYIYTSRRGVAAVCVYACVRTSPKCSYQFA